MPQIYLAVGKKKKEVGIRKLKERRKKKRKITVISDLNLSKKLVPFCLSWEIISKPSNYNSYSKINKWKVRSQKRRRKRKRKIKPLNLDIG